MLSTINPSDALHYVMVTAGVILLLKKVADMDKYHRVRVVVLTVTLSVLAILLFDRIGIRLADTGYSDCVIEFDDPSSEM